MLKVVLFIGLFALMAYATPTPGLRRVNEKYLISENHATFMEAYLTCKSFGFKLPTVLSEEDHLLLNNSLNPRNAYWLGAAYVHGNQFASKWVWIESGERLTYTKWGPGEPKVLEGDFCVMRTNFGTWTAIGCTFKINFVCET